MEIAKKKIAYNGIGLPIYERIEEVYTIDTPDYWTRLEHTYAGMAMQGILTNLGNTVDPDYIVEEAEAYATALVKKLKEEK